VARRRILDAEEGVQQRPHIARLMPWFALADIEDDDAPSFLGALRRPHRERKAVVAVQVQPTDRGLKGTGESVGPEVLRARVAFKLAIGLTVARALALQRFDERLYLLGCNDLERHRASLSA
jgi:hypothetical protein